MIDFLISIISCLFLVLSGLYLVKEIVRRRKQKNQDFLEVNWNIKISILFWNIGLIAVIGFTIAHYLQLFANSNTVGYAILCLNGIGFIAVSFILAMKKVTIDKKTNEGIACSVLRYKRFKLKDITLIKHSKDKWTVYSNQKKIFSVADRHLDIPDEFYIYLRIQSECRIISQKGYVSRNME